MYCVDFRDSYNFTPKETLDLVWNRLKASLNKKYYNYLDSFKDDYLEFSDNKINVSLDYRFLFGNKSLSIMYYDIYLLKQKNQTEENEL